MDLEYVRHRLGRLTRVMLRHPLHGVFSMKYQFRCRVFLTRGHETPCLCDNKVGSLMDA